MCLQVGSRVVQFALNGFESIGVISMLFIVLHLRVSSGLSAVAAIVNVSVFGCRLKSFHGHRFALYLRMCSRVALLALNVFECLVVFWCNITGVEYLVFLLTSEFDPLSAISIVFFRVSTENVSLSVIAILSSVVFRRCFIGLESVP